MMGRVMLLLLVVLPVSVLTTFMARAVKFCMNRLGFQDIEAGDPPPRWVLPMANPLWAPLWSLTQRAGRATFALGAFVKSHNKVTP
jgi:hypothetical protein